MAEAIKDEKLVDEARQAEDGADAAAPRRGGTEVGLTEQLNRKRRRGMGRELTALPPRSTVSAEERERRAPALI
jgi:hypothetical protein